ncbi:helix-turn-helix domain-containing protein [Brevundimonas vancanneytii]|uniref:Transcriptional regulatory protein, C terminal n=1 Tax=Brevundimonas vancanneytii TaxID=1325724 RepID=A0A4P1K333_9CAUL|nr:helix-turn-helix domain-containing protein [Brevundimonas vancanneytii]VTO14023.1 Transcriptional regulatory protein, C terminal [Brevundimonas vancanneytii]
MSRLERLGFDVAAGQWLELHRGHGRLLRLLVEAEGAIVTYDELLRDDYRHSRVEPSREGLKVRLCRLRQALEDVGMTGAVQCVWGLGYQLGVDPGPIRQAVEKAA